MAASYSTSSILMLLGVFVIVLLGYHSGEAIHCFECNSGYMYEKEKCKELTPQSTDFVVDCNTKNASNNLPYKRCRTMIQDVEGDVRMVRSCATWPDESKANRCIDRTGTSKIKIHYCECEGDKCNSAATLCSSALALLLAAVVGRAHL